MSPLASLINKGCSPIGGIYQLDYSRALVLTDDHRKGEAGGVPLGCYLLAVAGKATGEGFTLDDEEMILLRVRGTAPLPHEADLVQTRLAVVRDATNSQQTFDAVTDDLTLDELQQSAFDCEVLGTFYAPANGGPLEFGADIDNVTSAARYEVFLPSSEVLSWLASFPDTGGEDELPLGVVRFSSTRRRSAVSGTDQAAVRVHISDFVSRKTAVFGMTRTGKSNTIKTLVTAIHRYASVRGQRIGQVIFDPQGEYANVNKQDGTGLRRLGDEATVRIYRFGADNSDPQIRPLGMNFFDLAYFDVAASFVNSSVLEQYGSYAYVKNFTSINWEEPPRTSPSEWAAWSRARLGFYGLLSLCEFRADSFSDSSASQTGPEIEFVWSKQDCDEFESDQRHRGMISRPPGGGTYYKIRTPQAARAVTLFMAKKGSWNTSSKNEKDVRPFGFIAEVLSRASVKAAIRTLTEFHTANSQQRVEEQVWDDMTNGRLSIVDLSYGAGDAPRIISENIVNHILNQANARFRNDDDNVRLQVVVEEAHNLFERGSKETSSNPWVRLSKEAAKYDIGLVYATQEVTSVDQRILSNTSNWLVAHLNSDNETRELSHYYDYKTWAESLRRCEDVGFVRMKTYSGKYIVPIQIARFDHDMINQARIAAGLTPLAAGPSEGRE
ncbi:hypothetical protein Acy02nite_47070 [Actinoplanes cyaneus]|uniref:Helicase HerA central domain-containing protein n=1 Tax=Actinoplanes cyaneus TaxID=52696 RepID=A0A919IKN0_9ACTN|nr:DUF87 domain-containing protein [Actinoplanes cyaneus]MCW2138838.1 protein of unknown function DUF87 [Actinoplanes cyaneus]GID66826.1 hypothetical protein Acy02nite_47070 [Actinoplanes cyaneus]